jgi:hypothetical protein
MLRFSLLLGLWASLAVATDGGTLPSAGYLSVDSVPWAQVMVDGVSIGTTPLHKVQLRAGDHVVALGRHGEERRLTVTIQDGFTTRLRYEPAADPPIRLWVMSNKTPVEP